MSFVTAVRDYVDLINAHFDSFQQTFGSEITLAAVTKGTLLYLWQSIKVAFLYIFTLQWLRDLVYLPVIIPSFNLDTMRETFNHGRWADFAFVGTVTLVQNKFVVGFFNSFFAALPLTFAHLISARQFYVNGWRAAAATSAGIIAGHLFFLTAVLFGWRPVLIPWLQFEPGTFLIAFGATLYASKSVFGRRAFQQLTTRSELARTAGLGFLLMLCDQGVLFKYISTLTAGLEPTYLEPVTGTAQSLSQQHLLYLLGFLLGSVAFTAFFFWVASAFRQVVASAARISYINFAAHVNSFSQVAFVTALCMSLSFYGLDFVWAKPLGYVPYDRALVPGNFASYTVEDRKLSIHGVPAKSKESDTLPSGVPATKTQKAERSKKLFFAVAPRFPAAQDFDLASFDRGVYLRNVAGATSEMRTTESYRTPTSEFWSTRATRRKAPRGIFAKLLEGRVLKPEQSLSQPIKDALGLRMGTVPVTEDQRKRQSELEARLRARKLADMRRIWLMANRGSRQKFAQFTVYGNVNAPVESYVPQLTKRQISILGQLDDLLNVPKADYAANIEDIDRLIDRYYEQTLVGDDREAPLESRFNTVEDMTADIFEGQSATVQKSKRKLSIWPYMFGYLHEAQVNKALKQRVLHDRLRENPYVMALFRTDIDSFLSRQPKEQMLTSQEEANLFFKRVMLKNYVRTRQRTRRIFKSNKVLREVFDGSKSFANKVYNHQFNGTYRVVRQLMRIDLNPIVNREAARVMKYDMPLFKGDKDRMTSVHEELFSDLNAQRKNPRHRPKGLRGVSRRIRTANARPFYAGWDEDRRAFVLTSRFLPTRVHSRAMRFNENYPEFAAFDALGMETRSKAKSVKSPNTKKRIAFTTWPISTRIARDPLLYRNRPSVFMSDVPTRHDVRVLSQDESVTKEARNRRNKARSARILIQHFIPDFDFRPLQILFEEADKPNVSMRKARIAANLRISELPPPDEELPAPDEELSSLQNELPSTENDLPSPDEDVGEYEYSTVDRWPSGFIVPRRRTNAWWLEEKPPQPFVDRGGYVWPGHEQLKINMDHYLPKWKVPTFKMTKPLAKARKKA